MIDTNVNQAITEENIVTRILKYYLKYVSYVTVISNQRQTTQNNVQNNVV